MLLVAPSVAAPCNIRRGPKGPMPHRRLLALVFLLSSNEVRACPAPYALLGCYDDSGTRRIMSKFRQELIMSPEECYNICDDGVNTHFGIQYSNECWCVIDPELNESDAVDLDECSMPCAGTTVGEHCCGGFYKMMVYEITAYNRCDHEAFFAEARRLGSLPSSEDEQIVGQLWDFQEKVDTAKFFASTHGGSSLLSGDIPAGSCNMEDGHHKLLAGIDVYQHAANATPRVFCGIYTHQHFNHTPKVKAIKETWASHCDGFVAFSDIDDPELHSFKIKHEGPEAYANMWQKSRAIWKYVNFHYIGEFDWFVLGGDDLFIIVENLRKYLMSDEIKRAAGGSKLGGTNPVYLGRRLQPFRENHRIYNYGGPSYVLNRAAVRLLASHLDDDACKPHAKTSSEDVLVGQCLGKNGVKAFDTRDNFGRERFHPFTPATYLGPEEVVDNSPGGWFVIQAIDFKFGPECCSRDSISFHNVDGELMRRLYHLVYSCPRDPMDVMAQG